jgi:hypothetical protein
MNPDWIDELTADGVSGECLSAMALMPHTIDEYRRIKAKAGVAPKVSIENGAICFDLTGRYVVKNPRRFVKFSNLK